MIRKGAKVWRQAAVVIALGIDWWLPRKLEHARGESGNLPREGETRIRLWRVTMLDEMAYRGSMYQSNRLRGTGCAIIARW